MILAAALCGAPVLAHDIPVEACIQRIATPSAPPSNEGAGEGAGVACGERQNRLGAGDFRAELRFSPATPEPGDPLVLRFASVWQDSARLTFHFADGTSSETRFASGDASRFLTLGAIFEVPVPYRQVALTSVTVDTQGSVNLRGVMLGTQLKTRSASYSAKLRLAVLYAGFAGLALALVVYNLSLWVALRHRFQLLYCGMVTAIVGYVFTSSGAAMMVFPALANNDRLRLNYFLLAVAGVAALQFIRDFFDRHVFGPRLRLAIRVMSWASIGAAAAYALLAPWRMWWLDRMYSVVLTTLLCLVVPVLASAWHNRSRYFWMFVVAWSMPIGITALRALHAFDVLPYSFWLDNGNLVAMTVEALLSSVLVTMRLRELSVERDDARAGELVARRLAATDPLTGLLNRRSFHELAIGRKGRQRLMLIDVDHFKTINDRHGHDSGDQVLRAVADAIQSCRPPGSLAVRLGGEEFALLLPDAAIAGCHPERVLQAVRDHPMPVPARVSVSLGYADGLTVQDDDWRRLYRLADSALYRAKSDGRDRACRSTDFREVA